jgi:hypothetical protein
MVFVERLYQQIGQQIKGQLWKDGGRVIGVQLENEYNIDGPGKGIGHIAALKKLALKAGMDVPYYTVTGWDGTIYPSGEVTPVFGGYPDEPWGVSTKELPPKRPTPSASTRASAAILARRLRRMRRDGGNRQGCDAVPRRRIRRGPAVHVSPPHGGVGGRYRVDAAGAVGSGVNLMGYYMFHGGRNPLSLGGTGMEESTLSGGYNDTTMISYDFQAPLGRTSSARCWRSCVHSTCSCTISVRGWPMTVRKPDVSPAKPDDLATARFACAARAIAVSCS